MLNITNNEIGRFFLYFYIIIERERESIQNQFRRLGG
jgi:hypothetical protein